MNWIIENFTGDNGYTELISEVKNKGIDCHVLDITNHFNLNENIISKVESDCTIFQGSIQLFRKLKKETKTFPLGWMTDYNYKCSVYYPHFQEFLFNDKYCLAPLSCLKYNKFFFYGTFGKDTMIYVRPDDGDKTFPGRLLDFKDFDRMWDNSISSEAKISDLIVISTPKNIRGEWRFIVTDKKEIISYSTYRYQGNLTYIPSAPSEAIKLCKKLLDVGYYPDPIFTIDICEDNDGNFWLLELNSFTAAGTYAANKKLIIDKVNDIAYNQWLTYKKQNEPSIQI